MAQGGVFRPEKVVNMRLFGRFNPFGAERSLSTHDALHNIFNHLFQSLWNRERSFDMPVWSLMSVVVICFNPFRTGRGLSTVNTPKHSGLRCSFNPFGTGRGLSTKCITFMLEVI